MGAKAVVDVLLLGGGARSMGQLHLMRWYALYPLWIPLALLAMGIAFASPGPVVWKGRRYE
jgi:hypothetical protein